MTLLHTFVSSTHASKYIQVTPFCRSTRYTSKRQSAILYSQQTTKLPFLSLQKLLSTTINDVKTTTTTFPTKVIDNWQHMHTKFPSKKLGRKKHTNHWLLTHSVYTALQLHLNWLILNLIPTDWNKCVCVRVTRKVEEPKETRKEEKRLQFLPHNSRQHHWISIFLLFGSSSSPFILNVYDHLDQSRFLSSSS